MKISLRWSILLAALVLGRLDAETAKHAPFPFHSDDTRVNGLVQTSDGSVWAYQFHTRSLVMRDGDTWTTKHDFSDSKMDFQTMTPDAQDRLWILFQSRKGGHVDAYCIVRYDTRQLRVDFTRDLPMDHKEIGTNRWFKLWQDLQGRMWLTGEMPFVYRFEEDGACKLVVRFDDSMIARPIPNYLQTAQRLIFEDDGSIWLWSQTYASTTRYLKRPLRLDGETPEMLGADDVPGLPVGYYHDMASLVVDGRREWWLGIAGEGVWRMPAGGGAAKALEFPEDLKKNWAWRIFTANGKIWLVRSERNFEQRKTTNELWCRDVDGEWHKVIAHLDAGYPWFRHPFLETNEGLWVGTHYNGIWFVPANEAAEPRHFGGQQGFPLGQIEGVFPLPDGRLMAFEKQQGGICTFDVAKTLGYEAITPRSDVILSGNFGVIKGLEGRIFVCDANARALRQWDGRSWIDYPIPEPWKSVPGGHAADSRNRVWLIPENPDEAAYVLDIATGKWDTPRPYHDLVEEGTRDSTWHFLPQTDAQLTVSRGAVFSGSGQAAFCAGYKKLALFDGQWWRTLEGLPEIKGLAKDPVTGEILLRVGKDEVLRVNAQGAVAKEREKISDPSVTFVWSEKPKLDKERDKLWKDYNGLRTDEGDGWIFGKGMLWRVKDGHMVAWFSEGEPHPFVRQQQYYSGVVEDNFGNYLFYNSSEMIRVPIQVPHRLPSSFTLAVESTAEDSVRVNIGGVEGGWIRTRFGNGEWTDWEQTGRVEYKQLQPGDYRVEVEARNKHLEFSPVQEIKFSVKYDIDKPVREAVEKLFSKNWNERNEARKTLWRYHERARVLLEKIDRDKLDTNDRWWFDAALQQVEEKK